ncbi:MAG TPA: MBOAT family protein [Candidatus Fimenecus excrementigallinarum]|uniref:MBOAT family protein n=1 Tax=Candidatus Fimenecus excrementigallinarum TaxID=2840816 RepID=A0A9D1LDC5_9FIRM|nr:MBOAT family protein [Candidatus Fimenecus excrementigallinarum]
MVFSSLVFLYIFLPLCLAAYFIPKSIRVRNVVLLLFSLVFYAWGEPVYILLMVATTAVDFFAGLFIEKYRGTKKARLFLALAVILTLSSLGLFKYYDFFTTAANSLFSVQIPLLGVALPIGISFYTFQALTYVVDVYRDKVPVQTSFYKLLLYVSMFPQLIAGPIVRYSDVCEQIEARTCTVQKAAGGVVRFCIGLLKKTVLANFAGELCEQLFGGDLTTLTVLGAWVGILAYAFQIYFDFSGYSDMAIGLGKIFGFDFPENFRYPYIARSINDFWRRWHITLSTFFRDYVYIPMGGNRKRWAVNMLVVWLQTGLWHGASWNFVLWGLYYFVFLMLEKLWIGERLAKAPAVLGHIYSIVVILIGWVFFYFESLSEIQAFFLAAFGANGFSSVTQRTVIVNYIAVLPVCAVCALPVLPKAREMLLKIRSEKTRRLLISVGQTAFSAGALLVATAALVGSSYNPFLYFRF